MSTEIVPGITTAEMDAYPITAFLVLTAHLNVTNISDLDGCWEYQIDDAWWIALNGHQEPVACSRSSQPLDPAVLYVEFNGWPAGEVTPLGEGWFADGEVANPATFAAAIRAVVEGEAP